MLCFILFWLLNFGREQIPDDPSWPLAVTIGPAECAHVVRVSTSILTCIAPRYFGVGVSVVLYTPLQSSTSPTTITYSPPVIFELDTPQGRPIEGGFPIVISGKVVPSSDLANWCRIV